MRVSLFIIWTLFMSISSAQQFNLQNIDSINDLPYDIMVGDLKNNEILYKNVAESANLLEYPYGEGVALSKVGLILFYKAEYEKGIEYSTKAADLLEKLEEYDKIVSIYGDMAFVYRNVDTAQSLHYFRKAIALGENKNAEFGLAGVYDNYGVTLFEYKMDSALYYYNKSLEIKYALDDSIGIPYSLNKIAVYEASNGNYKRAKSLLHQSDIYRNLEAGDLGRADNLAYWGDVYMEEQKYDSAYYFYDKSRILSEKIDYNYCERWCLKQLIYIDEQQENYQRAYAHLKKLDQLENDHINLETKKAMAALQEEFHFVKQQQQIAQQNEEIAVKELEAQKNYNAFIYSLLGSILLFVVSSTVVIFIVYKRKRDKIAVEQKRKIEQAKLEQEFYEEKLRIGRELHDNIGSHLTFMINSVDNLSFVTDQANIKSKLDKIGTFGRSTMKELRSTIWAMKNDGGSLSDLVLKLQELKKIIPSNIMLNIDTEDMKEDYYLNASQILNVYRIIQEALQNSLKYADASQLTINLKSNFQGTSIIVKDDGKGFDLENANLGNGIHNIRRRAKDIQADIKLTTGNSGTEISIFLEYDKLRRAS